MKKKYEIMVIFSNELNEADVEKNVKSSIKNRLSEDGGTITFEDYWGAKGFAYIIKKQKWGYYYVARFELNSKKISEFRRELTIDKAVLRFMITSIEENTPEPKKFADLQAEYKALEKQVEDEKPEPETKKWSREKLTTVPETVAPEETAEPKTPKTKKKENEGDSVDKKLDDIIKNSSLDL